MDNFEVAELNVQYKANYPCLEYPVCGRAMHLLECGLPHLVLIMFA
jgi:hypothetical protein